MNKAKVLTIAALNDSFRQSLKYGDVMLSCSVASLPPELQIQVLYRVVNYFDFSDDNDPTGEHKFGSFKLGNKSFFWKIDYYDPDCRHLSADPSDFTKTQRVLTIMSSREHYCLNPGSDWRT